MAYSPDIVVGAWAGNTVAGAGGKPISAFGTEVGQTTLREFINGLPASRNWYQRPDGIVSGRGCPGDSSGEIFLAGTDRNPGCPSPTPTPTPSPSPSPTTSPSPTPTPTRPPSTPSPTPSPSATPS
jgi:hypothetical protein